MPVIANYDELEMDTPSKDFNSVLYKTFIKEAEKTVSIPHQLGRVPRRVYIVWSDNVIMQPEVSKMDMQKVILTFFESKTNIVLRIE